eukprot:CAMPEP_0172507750 /NCGR_PEP_ID=MMETSP1066-20121228/206213_1 /TAXON_ID=671091 /ORGANISM="Coscinodiscus wailesii, Strain CCMP2513" /LENGTH=52 /DNA_ID=CAMNT_0013285411 /DNA_START=269 /DNA_END=423 /DNA_ORIENTATION=-
MIERPGFVKIAPLLRGEMVARVEQSGGGGGKNEGFLNRSSHMMDLSLNSVRG